MRKIIFGTLVVLVLTWSNIEPVNAQTYPSGMISYWKFDEDSGETAYDSCGSNDGLVMNNPIWTVGKVEGALDFIPGTWVDSPYSEDFDNLVAITIESWIYRRNTNSSYIVIRGDPYYEPFFIRAEGDYLYGYIRNVDTTHVYFGASGLSINTWHHVAMTYDSNVDTPAVKLYMDGQEVASTPQSKAIYNAYESIIIGGAFNGIIDEVAIYNCALSPEEVLQHYENGLNGIGYNINSTPVSDAGDNIQITSAEQAYTVIQGTAIDPDGDPLTYRWIEDANVLLDWNDVGNNNEAYLDLATLPYFSIGNHTLTLEVNDGKVTSSDEMILTVDNSPPDVMPAPSYQVVEIGIYPIIVVVDVADFDGDTVSYDWLKDNESLASGTVGTVQGGETVPIPDLDIEAGDPRFQLGVHQIELQVSDGVNNPVSALVSVEVTDTTAPSLSPIPSKTMLWPPNHKLHSITIWANAFDNGGWAITLSVEVISSEPGDGTGDGNTEPDYYIDSVDSVTGTIELRLRAERSGSGNGRTYTIKITATDESGNQSVAIVEIFAPHDRRKK